MYTNYYQQQKKVWLKDDCNGKLKIQIIIIKHLHMYKILALDDP